MRALLVGLAIVIVGLGTSEARADLPTPKLVPDLTLGKDKSPDSAPQPDPWTTRPRTVSLLGGAPGGPTGVAGLSFEWAPIKYLVLGTGGGWSPDGGPRGAFMPRLRLPLNNRFAIGMGFPLSFGPYQFSETVREQCEYAGCQTGYRTTRTWAVAAWGHVEPNIEIRITPAAALRLFGGYARVLNDESDRCDSTLATGCPSKIGNQKWYGGLGLGYAW